MNLESKELTKIARRQVHLGKHQTIVVKYGSSSVTNDEGIDSERLQLYATHLAALHDAHDVIIVSSGSVAAGRQLCRRERNGLETADERTLAMIGSGITFGAWQTALLRHGIVSGQLLVTHREVDDLNEGPSLRAALETNIRHRIVTIANENDALSNTELAKLSYGGDNDGLAAHIAMTIKASALVLLTDQSGLLANGQPIKRIAATRNQWMAAYEHIQAQAGPIGRGGMRSKTDAAIQAARSGIEAYIAAADQPLQSILAGKTGTQFVAKK